MTTSTHPAAEGSGPKARGSGAEQNPVPVASRRPPSIPRKKSLGDVLRAAREGARLTLKELGEVLELAPSYLSDVENNRRSVTAQLCDQLSLALGLDRLSLYAKAGHLPESVRKYLVQTPRALHLLERLSERRASDAALCELIEWVDWRMVGKGRARDGEDSNFDTDSGGGHAGAGDPSQASGETGCMKQPSPGSDADAREDVDG